MLGLAPALTTWLLTGRRLRPADARDHGLVDESSPRPARAARQGPRRGSPPTPAPPSRGTGPATGCPAAPRRTPKLAAQLPAFPATLRKQLKGNRLPAPEAILATAVEGAQVDFDTAQLIETRRLITLLTGRIAKNMIGALFFDMRAVNGGLARPGRRGAAGDQGRGARRRHDGRRDRVRLRPRRPRRGGQGRHPGAGRARDPTGDPAVLARISTTADVEPTCAAATW